MLNNRDETVDMSPVILQATASSSGPSAQPGHHIHIQDQRISGSATVHNGNVFNITLPEDIAAEAAALSEVMQEARNACKVLYDLVGNTEDVFFDLRPISYDLQDMYRVLGTLRTHLNDEELRDGVVWAAASDNLSKVVESSSTLFADITARISTLKNTNVNISAFGMKQKGTGRNTLRSEEVEALRTNLMSHKITLNMAISMSALYQTSQTRHEFLAHRETLESVLRRLEEDRASQLPPAQPHRDIDRACVRIDYSYTLRHYLSSVASVLTSATSQTPPSMQISTLIRSNTSGTGQAFSTAYTTLGTYNASKCSQIFIRGLPNIRTMVLQVDPNRTIQSVKRHILDRTHLRNVSFQLVYRNRVLDDPRATLESYNVYHDSSLVCVSFKSTDRVLSMKIEMFQPHRECFVLGLKDIGLLVSDVTTYITDIRGPQGGRIFLLQNGEILEDDLPITSDKVGWVAGYCEFVAFVRSPLIQGDKYRGPLRGLYKDQKARREETTVITKLTSLLRRSNRHGYM